MNVNDLIHTLLKPPVSTGKSLEDLKGSLQEFLFSKSCHQQKMGGLRI